MFHLLLYRWEFLVSFQRHVRKRIGVDLRPLQSVILGLRVPGLSFEFFIGFWIKMHRIRKEFTMSFRAITLLCDWVFSQWDRQPVQRSQRLAWGRWYFFAWRSCGGTELGGRRQATDATTIDHQVGLVCHGTSWSSLIGNSSSKAWTNSSSLGSVIRMIAASQLRSNVVWCPWMWRHLGILTALGDAQKPP